MDYINDNVLRKYLAGEINPDNEKNKILVLDRELISICEGNTLLVKGEMTLIVGGKNSGKSKLMNHMLKQILLDQTDQGFKLINTDDIKVIYFDSEMSEDRLVKWAVLNVYNNFELNEIRNYLATKLYIYSLKSEPISNRTKCILDICNKFKFENPLTHFVICIDVGTCLTSDINNHSNSGVIDELVGALDQSSLIVTIHHSLKDDEKKGISMGSIGTALEKYSAIKLVINKTDEVNRHKVDFYDSKYEGVNKDKDYFYIHTEKVDNDKIVISGTSDSNGVIINKKKGNTKLEIDDFKFELETYFSKNINEIDRSRKNIVLYFKENFDIGKSKVNNDIKHLIEENYLEEIEHLIYFK